MSMFQRATRKNLKLRMALMGPSGSGKTYTALKLARGLAGPDGRIAVMDTEHRSAEAYAGDVTEFDTIAPESFSVETYIDIIEAAGREEYDVLVIDSLSHAWAGKDGLLEFVDQEKRKNRGGNDFTAWRNATPKHNQLIEAMLACRCHLIVTMRTKTEYVLEKNDRGKMVPRKIGLAPVQRDGLEYEFTVVGDIDLDHNLVISKTRCSAIADKVYTKPDEKLSLTLKAWLDSGDPAIEEPAQESPAVRNRTQPYEMSEKHKEHWATWLALKKKYNLDTSVLKEALCGESFADSTPTVISRVLADILAEHEKPPVPGPDEDLPFGAEKKEQSTETEPEPEPENLEDF